MRRGSPAGVREAIVAGSPALPPAIEDPDPLVRAADACVLGRCGGAGTVRTTPRSAVSDVAAGPFPDKSVRSRRTSLADLDAAAVTAAARAGAAVSQVADLLAALAARLMPSAVETPRSASSATGTLRSGRR
ncbi:hypothetical protein GCM10010168_23020 [Actinoplanes ianthinogenes]|uniref:Uncharacterized protein n=1 Tax=Actinoplanes ianthinogenes TaxID=122358 RepID=A0ABN6CRS4_9ACTN|nr:hypothetical protein [Actinoplanes ianthinogenes]BCJ47943.1 hypothetical protein Aiant_86000 [Actinoplanes ianthinogenes]GGR05240.1 hypothetical protein GCM10010168_23020 [Actinoplanes ianthinogenes]